MIRKEKINTLKAIIQECEEYECQRRETLFEIIKDLEQEPTDAVSRGVFEQVMWERDVAIGQLKELGYGLGQKID